MRARTVAATVAVLALGPLVGACGTASRIPQPESVASPPAPAAATRGTAPRRPRAPERRGSEDWRVTRQALRGEVAAYTTRASGVPGTRVGLKVSTTEGGWEASAFRIGSYEGGTGALVWESGSRVGREQPGPVFRPYATRTVVAPWKRDLTVDTSGWEPGFYVFRLRTDTGWETQVPYVVTSPSAAGTVALVAPVTTWQAYNQWGGYSLYAGADGDTRSHAVSFDRPYNGATGANDYRTAALPIVVGAEATGAPLSYFTNVDLHTTPGALDGARGYVSMGHDEYWTPTMRRVVLDARDAGTNLAFLGANTMYWRVRLAPGAGGPARVVVGYRHDAHLDPLYAQGSPEATALFRDPPAPRPEHDLLGMQYECYPVDTDYVVVTPGWWGFRGTGVRRGDHVHGLVGPEADRVYPDARLPRPLQVLAHSPYSCRGVTTSSQSVYYSMPSGAGVFTAGTLRWGCAMVDRCERPLGKDTQRFTRTVTHTLVREFARGPVGRRHPARDNVDAFDLPAVNTVPAS
ncbi:N,N-dimethylformamidase beta subunit family domain-containing protein [Nocardioides xinjiangensis]|uniref:N,N-dimethylformamidase beta subunit family domain-containing protein n=1 Tax=Nocardioides xinjiangensis TaxID=2817376 RepID=UPI001B304E72|nr:N,N-dimethylformamidase beta subunit family domain-containing protein [Nocardioides sp. SYSU D00778]